MLEITRIPEILKAYSKIPIEELLNRFSYEHTLIFNMNSIHISGDWLYIMEGKKLYWSPIYLPDPLVNPERFLSYALEAQIEIGQIAMLPTQYSEVLSTNHKAAKHGHHIIYIYDNNEKMMQSQGKDYERFRVARKYLNDLDITVDIFDNKNMIDLNTFNDIHNTIEAWKDYEESKGIRVNYRPIRVTENLLKYGHMIDFITMVVRYKGELVSFFTSERLAPNYVILTDGKVNFRLDKSIERKFQYVQHLQHWMHLNHWNSKEHDTSKPIYFNIGMSGPDSYKNRFRPVQKLVEYRYNVKEEFAVVEKSNDLF